MYAAVASQPPPPAARARQKLTLPGMGAAYGTAKSGIGIAGVGTYRPDLIMKSLIPVVMSGILAVYALVISVLIASDLRPPPDQQYSLFAGFMHMAAGMSGGSRCGLRHWNRWGRGMFGHSMHFEARTSR